MNTEAEKLIRMRVGDLLHAEIFKGISIPRPELIGDESYIEIRNLGISLVLPDGDTISAVHLHGDGHDGYAVYRGNIPGGIGFFMSKRRVREMLGNPAQAGGGKEIPMLGFVPEWEKYRLDSIWVHVEYSHDNMSIRLVTLSEYE